VTVGELVAFLKEQNQDALVVLTATRWVDESITAATEIKCEAGFCADNAGEPEYFLAPADMEEWREKHAPGQNLRYCGWVPAVHIEGKFSDSNS
jgi:hypothetical protein